MLRIILNKTLGDKVPISRMFEGTKMLSINQIACLGTVIDIWNAIK